MSIPYDFTCEKTYRPNEEKIRENKVVPQGETKKIDANFAIIGNYKLPYALMGRRVLRAVS